MMSVQRSASCGRRSPPTRPASLEPVRRRFVVRKGSGKYFHLSYSVGDFLPPVARNDKRLYVSADIANCGGPSVPTGFMEAFFDDVYVNESASMKACGSLAGSDHLPSEN